MKLNELKKIIKEAVREAIRDELKEILLEAIKGGNSSQTISEVSKPSVGFDKEKLKSRFLSLQEGEGGFKSEYKPPSINTAAEGSALPDGEVSLEQINSLTNR